MTFGHMQSKNKIDLVEVTNSEKMEQSDHLANQHKKEFGSILCDSCLKLFVAFTFSMKSLC